MNERYRTFWRRLGAGFIDGLIFKPLELVEKLIIADMANQLVVSSWILFHTWSYVIYSVLMLGLRGQTLGKMVCRVRVLDASSEAPITFRHALLRDSVPIVINIIMTVYLLKNQTLYWQIVKNQRPESLPLPLVIFAGFGVIWFLLELITMLTNKKRRALHDFIGGTVVCKDA